MKTSADGRAFIEAFEGKFLHTYDDGTGVLTIGYGHTTAAGPPSVCKGQTITDAECDQILADDLEKVERNVESCINVSLEQYQFDALVSFDFNTGALAKSSVSSKLNAGNPIAAMATLLQYDHAGGQELAGLRRRRIAERMMFTGQVDQAMKVAGAHRAIGGTMPQKVDPPKTPIDLPPVIKPEPKPFNPAKPWWLALIDFILSLFKR